MKTRKVISCLLLLAILVTAFVPLNVFAGTTVNTYSISGYIGINEYLYYPSSSVIIDNNIPEQKLPFGVDQLLKKGIKVEVTGTELSAYTDSNGFFTIKNVPEKDAGYVLKLSGNYLKNEEVVIESFKSDTKVSPEMSALADADNDGSFTVSDIMLYAKLLNSNLSISGYVSVRGGMPNFDASGAVGIPEQFPAEFYEGLKAGVKVEILGTDLYTYTDSNGYFIINQVPANSGGYSLRLSGQFLYNYEIIIETFISSIEVSLEKTPTVMEIDWDINDDGTINMTDIIYLASLLNKTVTDCKISGYIKVDREWTYGDFESGKTFYVPEQFSESLKNGVKVEVDGTDLSAVSDKNGYFEIANVPLKETGYVLKFSRDLLTTKSITVQSLTKDTAVSTAKSPIVMSISGDLNNDGTSNMSDVMVLAQYFNEIYFKVSGYINPDFDYSLPYRSVLQAGFEVEVKGTGISAITDGNGYFELLISSKLTDAPADTAAGDSGYTLKVSKANYLYKELKIDKVTRNVLISSPGSPISMEIGDFNADNAVNISDIMLVVSAFNSTIDDEKFAEDYDINRDGAVNIKDVLIVAKNYCKTAASV